jgi:hypothetical protein
MLSGHAAPAVVRRAVAGGKKGFSVPLGEGVHGYRLLSVMALDDMGYPRAVTDDTAAVVASREAAQRQACERMRRPV